MLSNYLPIIVFIVLALLFGFVPLLMGTLLAPHRPNAEKYSQYECGFAPFEGARAKFDVRFYLVAILFILFDLEVAFLLPWAVVFRELGNAAFWAMLAFLGLLLLGFAYEWRKGALEWE